MANPTAPGRLLLLDTASLYFRAFYGVPDSLRSPGGQPVNAVRGLLDAIARLLTELRPAGLVACWDDDWRPQFRVDALPAYKANRVAEGGEAEDVPDLLTPQVPVIVEVLEALGLARVGMPGYEADDVIGTLATRAAGPVDIVTGDRDLFQLVDDTKPVRVLYTARGVANLEPYDEKALRAKYGVPGAAYADFAVLRGDPSDGLPGVPGIGEKTAASLITRYGDLAGVLAAVHDVRSGLSPSVGKRLVAAADYLAVAPSVVHVVRDLDLPEHDERVPAAPRDPQRLAVLQERWGLGGSVDRVVAAMGRRS